MYMLVFLENALNVCVSYPIVKKCRFADVIRQRDIEGGGTGEPS